MNSAPAPMDPEVSPPAQLWGLVTAHVIARCLHTVADAGVADAIGETPVDVATLADATGLHPDALHRMLRLLAAHGVFAQTATGYGHTAASALLRIAGLAHAARTGRPLADWTALLAHFETHPDEAALFNQAMVDKSRAVLPAVVAAHDFAAYPLIADVGGGRGHLLQAILAAAPASRGVLFELPQVIATVAAIASPRLHLVGGDFFREAVPSADAYVLMEVLHDWDDGDALRILATLRRDAPPHARLLVIETLVPDAAVQHPGQVLDIIMLAVTGGRERSEADYRDLLARGGWALERIVPTASPLSLVEAVPA